MTNEQLTTKGISANDLLEKKSKLMLESKIPSDEGVFIWYGDKFPNLDGHIEFFNQGMSTTIKLFFQLKCSEQDINYYDCDSSFLNYCYQSAQPTFLIFVNTVQQKIYWEYVTKAYISSILQIMDLNKFSQKTKRITFSDGKLIENNTKELEDICKKHNQNNGTDVSIQQDATIVLQQVAGDNNQSNDNDLNLLKKILSKSLSKAIDKSILYYVFVYILKPFYIDQRGKEKRKKLINLLRITASQEHFLLETLIDANLIGKTGNLIFVTERENAVSVLNHYLDTKQLNLDQITKIFS